MNKQRLKKIPVWKVFGVPAVLGLVSLVGLLSALIGDGIFDLLSWLSLFAPIGAIIWALGLRKRSET